MHIKVKKQWVISCLLITVFGCSKNIKAEDTVLHIGNSEIAHEVSSILRSREVWYQITPKNNIKVRNLNETLKIVVPIVREIVEKHVPDERNISVDESDEQKYINKFKENEISFKLVNLDGIKYLVWREGDASAASVLVNEILLE